MVMQFKTLTTEMAHFWTTAFLTLWEIFLALIFQKYEKNVGLKVKSDFCWKLLLSSVLRYLNHCCFLYSELKLFMSTVCIVVMCWTGSPPACVRSLLVTIFTFQEKVWVKRDLTCPKPNQMMLCNLKHWSKSMPSP